VKAALGGDGPFIAAASGEIYFKPGVYDRLRMDRGAMRDIAAATAKVPGVARVLWSDEISTAAARTSKDAQLRAAALTYFPGRSGDLFVVPRENWMMTTVGTTHGSWYDYDQRIPVLLYGAGIQAGARDEAVTPADIAPTIASIVGVRLPAPDGRVLSSALKKR